MKFALLAAVAIATASSSVPAAAASDAELCALLEPCKAPAAFTNKPYLAKPVIKEVSMSEVRLACINPDVAVSHAQNPLGCTSFEGNSCVITIPAELKNVSGQLYRLVLEHELAHCRGWVHPQY
jgi:hypothetical protein